MMAPVRKPRSSGSRRAAQAGGRSGEPASRPGADLVQSAAQVAEIASRLAGQQLIAFDTEFIRERTFYPQLGLIQLADREEAWLIDPLALSPEDLRPLIEIWTDKRILKAAHAVEQDQECLYHAYGIVAAPVFDTAIGAALTGRGDQIGLSALLQKALGVRLAKAHTRSEWLKRPLPAVMAAYALSDVQHLTALAEFLLADLDRRGRRQWALDLSAEFSRPERYNPDPGALARRLAGGKGLDPLEYAVLRELVRWREERVRRSNLPRRWVADDSLLLKLAYARPAQVDELRHFRGLGPKTIENGGREIVRAVRKALETPPEQRPEPPPRSQPGAEESASLGVLKCFLTLLAREHEVPLRYLVDPDDAVRLLRRPFRSVEELRESGLLKAAAADLFGEELLAILHGKRALKLTGGRAERYKIPGDK